MAGLKKKRRIQLIVIGLGLMAVSAALIGFAFKDGINYFRSPSQVIESTPNSNEVFRIGGLVEEGSFSQSGSTYRFDVTDGNAQVPIVYTGVLPDLFREGQGIVALGRIENGTFEANEILAKHDENYMPREVIDALKEQGIYQPNAE